MSSGAYTKRFVKKIRAEQRSRRLGVAKRPTRAASGQERAAKRLWHAAERRMFDVCRTFNEIQTGPNPLTPDEIERLIAKRPEVYGVLRACVKR